MTNATRTWGFAGFLPSGRQSRVVIPSPTVEGSYRQQIVESEAKRLARVRRRYQRAWRQLALKQAPLLLVAAGFAVSVPLFQVGGPFFIAGCAAVLLPAGIGLGLYFSWGECPRCGRPFSMREGKLLQPRDTTESRCVNCGVPRGYVPAPEDLGARDELVKQWTATSRVDAEAAASTWLATFDFEQPLVLVDCRETPTSWVFCTGFASGEPGFGNSPVVVRKRDARTYFCPEATLEFCNQLGVLNKLKRTINRRWRY